MVSYNPTQEQENNEIPAQETQEENVERNEEDPQDDQAGAPFQSPVNSAWVSYAADQAKKGLHVADEQSAKGLETAKNATAQGLTVARSFTAGLLDWGLSYLATRSQNADDDSTRVTVNGYVNKGFDVVERVALGGIDVGAMVTKAGLNVAEFSVEKMDEVLGQPRPQTEAQ
ncbi:hypothetical protein PROFUN_03459 [Planoprotostelium fungivorum]|uniref:Senescence domain-containing protein n=1 Tax=Planoprotostelium fungivorum TaxID=1890364 RepID=A0A2P6MN80_9EUKA|nr:hypothetical protein PROFUN_03459 [Planoprotostelium fungivorum]